MFAQQVVHDKDGNLLFFIVDNNIYNKYGKAFLRYDSEESTVPIGSGIYNYLHNPLAHTSLGLPGENFNRFGFSEPNQTLDPEIVIFPIHGSCYEFGIVYSIYNYTGIGFSSTILYTKLKYINDEKIFLTEPIELSEYFPSKQGCWNYSVRNLAITDYRPDHNNYLLFIHYFNWLLILKIDQNGDVVFNTSSPGNLDMVDINLLPTSGDYIMQPQHSSEMEVVKHNNGTNDYYYVAMGACWGAPIKKNAKVHFVVIDYDNLNTVSISLDSLPESTLGPEIYEYIKGLEFSPDCHRLYVTYKGQSNFNFFDVGETGFSRNYIQGINDNPEDYQYSEIENGRDGNMYFLFNDEDGNTGGVSRLSNPNNANYSNWDRDCFHDNINKVYFSHNNDLSEYPDAKILLFADQVDGSDYVSYFETVDQECCIDHIYYSNWPDDTEFSETNTWTPENCPFPNVNGIVWIDKDVAIPAGKEVTIQNLKIKFNANKKLIVEQGAKLILDNSILTSVDECQQTVFWGGIEVWGNSSQHQFTIDGDCYQGTVILENGL